MPEDIVEQRRQITGTMPPAEPAADLPILVVLEVSVPAPIPQDAAAFPPKSLPKTGSQLPLIGLVGVLAIISGPGLRTARLRAIRART